MPARLFQILPWTPTTVSARARRRRWSRSAGGRIARVALAFAARPLATFHINERVGLYRSGVGHRLRPPFGQKQRANGVPHVVGPPTHEPAQIDPIGGLDLRDS